MKKKYGEFNCAELKPQWDFPKPRGDKNGYVRGAVGIDGLLDNDGDEYTKTFDHKKDMFIYGPTTSQRRRDGAMQVHFAATKDPGKIENHEDDGTSPGYSGVDR
jgi:hypothetical protein